jgi:hypothetical protein
MQGHSKIPTFLPFLERVCRDRTRDTGKEQTKMTQCKYTAQFNKCIVHCARRKLEDLLPMTRTLLLSFYLDHSFFVRAQLWGWTSKTVSEVLIIAKTLELADFKQSVVYTRSFLKVLFEECHSKFLRWCFVVFCNMSTDCNMVICTKTECLNLEGTLADISVKDSFKLRIQR